MTKCPSSCCMWCNQSTLLVIFTLIFKWYEENIMAENQTYKCTRWWRENLSRKEKNVSLLALGTYFFANYRRQDITFTFMSQMVLQHHPPLFKFGQIMVSLICNYFSVCTHLFFAVRWFNIGVFCRICQWQGLSMHLWSKNQTRYVDMK